MGKMNCLVPGCQKKMRYGEKSFNEQKISFFRFPSVISHQGERTQKLSELRRQKWFALVCNNKEEYLPAEIKERKICSDHFVTGKPAGLYEFNKPDWLPSLVTNGKLPKKEVDRVLRIKAMIKSSLEDLGLYPFIDKGKIINTQNVEVHLKEKYIENVINQYKPVTIPAKACKSNTEVSNMLTKVLDEAKQEIMDSTLLEPKLEMIENTCIQNCSKSDTNVQNETEITPHLNNSTEHDIHITPNIQEQEDTPNSPSSSEHQTTKMVQFSLPHFIALPPNSTNFANSNLQDSVPQDEYINALSNRIKFLQEERDTYVNNLTTQINSLKEERNTLVVNLANQMKALQDELRVRNEEVYELRSKVSKMTLDEGFLEGDNPKTNFYTGVPTFEAFIELYESVKDNLKSLKMSLTPFQQLLMTCMKMQLNVPQRDLSYRFGISGATISRIFGQCLDVLHKKFIPPECDMSNLDDPNVEGDDDAPPEVQGFQNAREYAMLEQKEIANKAKEKQQQLKDKRKEIHERNATQKEIKLAKIKKLGTKKLPAAFLEKVAVFTAKKNEMKFNHPRGEKRKAQEVFDDVREENNEINENNETYPNNEEENSTYENERCREAEAENFYSIHGSTEFEVVPIGNAMEKSTVSNSALEFKMRRANGSNVQRESVQEMLSKKKKQSVKLQYTQL